MISTNVSLQPSMLPPTMFLETECLAVWMKTFMRIRINDDNYLLLSSTEKRSVITPETTRETMEYRSCRSETDFTRDDTSWRTECTGPV